MDFTPEQIAALGAMVAQQAQAAPAATPAAAPAPAEPQPLTFNIGGQQFTARDSAEAQRIIDQAQANSQANADAERIRIQAEAQRAIARTQQAAQPQPQQFDKEQYAKLFLDDPIKANQYLMAHDTGLLSFYTGLVGEVQQHANRLSELQQTVETQQFLLHTPDYESTPQNYAALEGVMKQYSLPWNYAGLKMAHTYAKQANMLAATPEPEPEPAPAPTPINAPPALRKQRGGTVSEAEAMLSNFGDLPLDKMREVLQNFGR